MAQLSLEGICPRCGRDVGQAAFERAVQAVEQLLQTIGASERERVLVCSVHAPVRPLAASVDPRPGRGRRSSTRPCPGSPSCAGCWPSPSRPGAPGAGAPHPAGRLRRHGACRS